MNPRLPILVCSLIASAALVAAQPGPSGGKGGPKKGDSPDLVEYVLSFGKKKAGQVTKDELTDRRLWTVFELSDANKDGVVTRDEIAAFATKLAAEEQAGGDKGGKKGPKGKGP